MKKALKIQSVLLLGVTAILLAGCGAQTTPRSQPPPVNDVGVAGPETIPVDNKKPESSVVVNAICDGEEFSRLSTWSVYLEQANQAIAKLGARSNWKYDSASISSSTNAVRACEPLIKYHAEKPCKRNVKLNDGSATVREYTRKTISERCEVVRSYYYDYLQRTSTLNSDNADLYIGLGGLGVARFDAQSMKDVGPCVIENKTDHVIDYTGKMALVTSSRGFEDKLMILETKEGLSVKCYGLDLKGPFSKTEIVRLLKNEGGNIRLEYVLK
ncbi:MAG: hypothetical protein ACK41T_09945 [Pseudobdellovibrio sp.]